MRRLFIPLLLSAILPVLAFAQGGETGFAALKFGALARTIGMGDLGVTDAKGPMALHYNPAALADQQNAGISFSHLNQVLDVSTQYVGAAAGFNGYTLGFHVMYNGVGGAELRDRPGPAQGEFESYYLSTGLTFAMPLFERFEAGVTAKLLFEKIHVDEATGYAFDLGARYQPFADGTLKDLSAGVGVFNLGAMSNLADTSTTLPALLRYGVSYPFQVGSGKSTLSVTGGAVTNITAGITHASVGAEFGYDGIAYLRAGYLSGYDNKNISFGAGVEFFMLAFDFAYVPASNGFSDESAISLILTL